MKHERASRETERFQNGAALPLDQVSQWLDISRKPTERKSAGLYMIEGLRALRGALRCDAKLELVLTSETSGESVAEVTAEFAPHTAIEHTSKDVISRLITRERSDLVVGFARQPDPPPLHAPATLLAGLHNPGNLGSILRTAAGFGITPVVAGCCELFHPRVVRASAGTVALGALETAGLDDAIELVRAKGLPLVAAVSHHGDDLGEIELANSCIMLGSEAFGLPDWAIEAADVKVSIQMQPVIDSLNVAAAAAILFSRACTTK